LLLGEGALNRHTNWKLAFCIPAMLGGTERTGKGRRDLTIGYERKETAALQGIKKHSQGTEEGRM
jgi:hypothetical protein